MMSFVIDSLSVLTSDDWIKQIMLKEGKELIPHLMHLLQVTK